MIPRVAHLYWSGSELPWVYWLALKSALRFGGFDQVSLYHTEALHETRGWDKLADDPRFDPVLTSDRQLLNELWGPDLAELGSSLESKVAVSNLVRAAVLHANGGVYLDMDTITVRSFAELCRASDAFVGEERIVFPARVSRSKHVLTRGTASTRSLLRSVLRSMPHGYRVFDQVEQWYPLAVNGAVLGAPAGHPFLAEYVEAMLRLPETWRQRPHALGTHLLQETLAASAHERRVHRCPPRVFYPLAPEVSRHWFRTYPGGVSLRPVIRPETLLAHWYASVGTRSLMPQIDESYVRRWASCQLFSQLALRVLDGEAFA